MATNTNQRVARNTVLMYLRTLITIVVSLLTTRVVLKILGVEDYGIYGIIGGMVVLFNFLNRSMSAATSRFMTFELGRGDYKRLTDTFNASMSAHIIIALIILVIAETAGLWFVSTKLVIPPERMYAAHWVYQLTIATSLLNITQSPYNAAIFAHEDMDVYAIIEIIKYVLLLAIVIPLKVWENSVDKLILYAILYFVVVALIMIVYRVYCIKKYDETHYKWRFKRHILTPMIKYSMLDLYGSGCFSFRQYGMNAVINMFFGVVYNSTSTIATYVFGGLQSLSYAVVLAFRPQVIKQYAIGNVDEMQRLIRRACKYSIILMACMATPIIIEMPKVLDIWLGNDVPPDAVIFCRLLVLSSICAIINATITTAIHATGKIVSLSIFGGTISLLSVPAVWLLYKIGLPAYHAYTVLIIASILILTVDLIILKRLIPQIKMLSLNFAIFQGLAVFFICALATYFVHINMSQSFLRLIVVVFVNITLLSVVTYVFILDREMRTKINKKLHLTFLS